jgi:hypothetical protein
MPSSLTCLPLSLPSTLEVYDTKNEAKFFKEGTSFKEFELILIPRQPGSLDNSRHPNQRL